MGHFCNLVLWLSLIERVVLFSFKVLLSTLAVWDWNLGVPSLCFNLKQNRGVDVTCETRRLVRYLDWKCINVGKSKYSGEVHLTSEWDLVIFFLCHLSFRVTKFVVAVCIVCYHIIACI